MKFADVQKIADSVEQLSKRFDARVARKDAVSVEDLDNAAIRDLLADARQAEVQAKEGPFYVTGKYGSRIVTTNPEEIRSEKQSLLAYAKKCREQAEKYRKGGAHKAVLRSDSSPYRYRTTLRPASRSTLPQGVKWEYIEAPPDLTTRPDLPRSQFRYGIIGLDRKLTEEEKHHFDIVEA